MQAERSVARGLQRASVHDGHVLAGDGVHQGLERYPRVDAGPASGLGIGALRGGDALSGKDGVQF